MTGSTTVLAQTEKAKNLPATNPAQLLQIAVESGADIERLEKLMDMQMRWEENEARKAFVGAMAAFRAEAPRIVKNAEVSYSGTHYRHSTLDHVMDQINPILAKHGLSVGWSTDQAEGAVSVTCELTHEQGHSTKTTLSSQPDASGKKNSIQAIGSAVKYLQRYTVMAALGLADSLNENDGHPAPTAITDHQANQLRAMLDSGGVPEQQAEDYLQSKGIEGIDAIPAANYEAVVKAFNKAIEARRASNADS